MPDLNWDPPEGMARVVAQRWRAFYRAALAEYQITPREYRLLYIAQRGRCWICQKAKGIHPDDPKGAGYRRLAIDHNHATGAVRGLLCSGGDKTCNRMIGWHRDDPAVFRRAADYLENPPARVLRVVTHADADAARAGARLDDAQMDLLAVAFLWP